MSESGTAPRVRPNKYDLLTFTFGDRHWRVRGLEKQLSCERMHVNLTISRHGRAHVDTFDLYVAHRRRVFTREAAAELYIDESAVNHDLGRVLLQLEQRQEELIRQELSQSEPDPPVATPEQREQALAMLKDPRLVDRILGDLDSCGLVGEETVKLVCYLACVSRLLPEPLAVLIRSGSAAGKTTLQDAVLRFMPQEQQLRLSALTGQSLYYLRPDQLRHKILAIAEEDGLGEAAYALKVLQSDGRLRHASAGRNGETGRQQTELYEVEGPVALLLTSTAQSPHPELVNRCLCVWADEHPRQTAAIHQRQRAAYLHHTRECDTEAIATRHQHVQRLLNALKVVIPWAEQLTFRTDQTRFRRDHAHYLTLIASSTLLHQYQREQYTRFEQSQPQKYVVATVEDIELANRLAAEVLCEHPDSLMPQTRRLLCDLTRYVTRRAAADGVAETQVRFTQRQLREALGRSDRSVRTHLARLVELEYVIAHRTGIGNLREYQLACGVCRDEESPAVSSLGLVDVRQLCAGAFHKSR